MTLFKPNLLAYFSKFSRVQSKNAVSHQILVHISAMTMKMVISDRGPTGGMMSYLPTIQTILRIMFFIHNLKMRKHDLSDS